jgi:hypothetical protein
VEAQPGAVRVGKSGRSKNRIWILRSGESEPDPHQSEKPFSSIPSPGECVCRCPKGNAAEAVAEKLDKKLRDNLKDARNSLFTRYRKFLFMQGVPGISMLWVRILEYLFTFLSLDSWRQPEIFNFIIFLRFSGMILFFKYFFYYIR